MADLVSGFAHRDAGKKDDKTRAAEARAHLGKRPELQIVAELLAKLRELSLSWWTPAILRGRWSAETRMEWLKDRPDLRQQITVGLTGLAPKAARRQKPSFQAALIDSVLDEGDVTVDAFEAAFEPSDLVVYGSAVELWREFRERMPWEDDSKQHQALIAWLLHALVTEESATPGIKRKPILTHWEVRSRIEGRVWHTHIPLDTRIAIDAARLEREKAEPTKAFSAIDDLAIATPEIITENIPLRDLMEVFLAAERAIGFEPAPPPAPPLDTKKKSIAPPPPAATPAPTAPTEAPARATASAAPPKPLSIPPRSGGTARPPANPPEEPEEEPPVSLPEPTTTRNREKLEAAAAAAAQPAAPPGGIVSFPDTAAASTRGGSPVITTTPDEDDLARTNPWAVPSVDDMWTGDGDYKPPSVPFIAEEATDHEADDAFELKTSPKRRSGGRG